jgi:hypothetical protein
VRAPTAWATPSEEALERSLTMRFEARARDWIRACCCFWEAMENGLAGAPHPTSAARRLSAAAALPILLNSPLLIMASLKVSYRAKQVNACLCAG